MALTSGEWGYILISAYICLVYFFLLVKEKTNWSKYMTLSHIQRVLDVYLFIHAQGGFELEVSEPHEKPVACSLRNGHSFLLQIL